jgi:hypothetical protein
MSRGGNEKCRAESAGRGPAVRTGMRHSRRMAPERREPRTESWERGCRFWLLRNWNSSRGRRWIYISTSGTRRRAGAKGGSARARGRPMGGGLIGDGDDQRAERTGHPVRSAIHKLQIGRLVVGWVTTSEYLLLYVFFIFYFLFFILLCISSRWTSQHSHTSRVK